MKKLYLIFLLASLLSACATTSEPSEAYKGMTPEQIFREGKKDLENRSYSEAIKHFEALDVQYPFGADTERAQLYLIYVYYMKEEYALSVAAADRFIRLHPTNAHVDYAFYMRGLANYYLNIGVLESIFSVDLATRDLRSLKKSYLDFSELTARFPNSKYAAAAHQYMIYLRNILAKHELQVAQYYYNRRAYLAAANRASDLVAHYQGSPSVIDGLILMVKSYHFLGLKKLEQDTYFVLRYNYPDVVVTVEPE